MAAPTRSGPLCAWDRFTVLLMLEGIPPYAWDREVVEDLLSSACLVDTVAPETSSRVDLSSFKLSAWTADPEAIPSLRWLAVPEPGMVVPLSQPALLQYRILIHVYAITDYNEVDEPWFLRGSSDCGKSGIPDSGDDHGGGDAVTRHPSWQFGVRDARASSSGTRRRGGGGGGYSRAPIAQDWRLPPMGSPLVVARCGPTTSVRDMLSVRLFAFDRIDRPAGAPEASLNPVRAQEKGPEDRLGRTLGEERVPKAGANAETQRMET